MKEIFQILLQGKKALPNALRAVETNRGSAVRSCWLLLCVVYAMGYHDLLMPLCRLLKHGLLRQPSRKVPEEFQALLEQEFRRQDVAEALQVYGSSLRYITEDRTFSAEIIRLHVSSAKKGHLVFVLRCPACGNIMPTDFFGSMMIDKKLNCIVCFAKLSVKLTSIQSAAKESVVHFVSSLQKHSCQDKTKIDSLLAAAILLRGCVDIFFIRLRAERIGHLILNTALFLSELKRDNRLERSLIFAFPNDRRHISNTYLLQFWSQYMKFGPWVERVFSLCQNNPVLQELAIDLVVTRRFEQDLSGMLDQHHIPLHFTEQEHQKARRHLTAMGLPIDAKYVCILGRDENYLQKHLPSAPSGSWSYHDYRNVQLENYLPAMHWLGKQGFYCLRMGHMVKDPLESDDSWIIEYATHHRTPFMDIYLASTCEFYISCMTGPDIMPLIMHKPLLLVNVPQYRSALFLSNSHVLIAFKKAYCYSLGRYLSFAEMMQRGLGNIVHTQEMIDSGIFLEENTREELLAIVEEMTARCAGTWIETDEELQAQRLFKEIVVRYSPTARIVRAKISMAFLRMNPSFLTLDSPLLEKDGNDSI